MYVRRLSIEDERVRGQDSPELNVCNPIWDQIEKAIRQLDGTYRTMVIIGKEDTEFDYMVIGGGRDQVYCCGLYDKQGREFTVVDPSKSSVTYVEVPTGQPTSVPLRETIGLEDALRAAREYAETGTRAKDLPWDEHK